MTDALNAFGCLVQDNLTRVELMEEAMKIVRAFDRHGLIDRIDERPSTKLIGDFSFFAYRRTDSENIISCLTGVTLRFIDIGSGSDDRRDASLDDLSGFGFAHLVSQSYFVACFDEFGDILIDTMIGHACHRDGVL